MLSFLTAKKKTFVIKNCSSSVNSLIAGVRVVRLHFTKLYLKYFIAAVKFQNYIFSFLINVSGLINPLLEL